MLICENGAQFEYQGTKYVIGEPVIATNASEYEGLIGTVYEIRDGEDKETENSTPDMYCRFDPPILLHGIRKLEATFSELYNEPKKLEDIILDMVIMAPEMIMPLRELDKSKQALPIYVLHEDWAIDGEPGQSTGYFANYQLAAIAFHRALYEEKQSGLIQDWECNNSYQVESGESFFECWLDKEYIDNHYKISISPEPLIISEKSFSEDCP